MKTRVLESFLLKCERTPLPEQWAQLGDVIECYRSIEDGPRLVNQLAAEFDRDTLVDAGIAVVHDNELALVPALLDRDQQLLALRNGCDNLAILTSHGIVGASVPSAVICAKSARDNGTDLAELAVFVAPTVRDAAVLRAAGLQATVWDGILDCGREQLEALCENFGWSARKSTGLPTRDPAEPIFINPDCDDNEKPAKSEQIEAAPEQEARTAAAVETDHQYCSLIFVNWSPAEVDQVSLPGAFSVIASLVRLEEHLDLRLSNVGVWRPSRASFEKLRTRLHLGSAESIAEHLNKSIDSETESLDGYMRRVRIGEAPLDHSNAARQFIELLLAGANSHDDAARLRESMGQFLKISEQERVLPLRELANSSKSQLRRTLYDALADTVMLFSMQYIEAQVATARASASSQSCDRELKALWPTLDRICKIANALNR